MRSVRVLAVFSLLLGGLVVAGAPVSAAEGVTAGPATTSPGVTVQPDVHLAGGQTVHVHATGVPPLATAYVYLCDRPDYLGLDDRGCGNGVMVTADPTGTVVTDLTLTDPVYDVPDDPLTGKPAYCRADICHVYVEWGDPSVDALASPALYFTGYPAVIVVRPNSHLAATERVAVSGSAHGAQGRKVQVVEEICFNIIQDTECDPMLPPVTVTAGAGGLFGTHYVVHRFLGTNDCLDLNASGWPENAANCQLTVKVLKNGQPDISYGDPSWGDPHGWLHFSGSVAASSG